MGIRRDDTDRLFALANETRVHVRVDAPGTPLVDDQTIQDVPKASPTRKTIQSKRTYLCDASFVAVVVPGASSSVDEIGKALSHPVFAPFLGRRTCVPSSLLLLAAEVKGNDPLELFKTLVRGPGELLEELRESHRLDEKMDFYLDAADHPRRLRRLPVRDDLAGPLPRQFRERVVVHVRDGGPASSPGPADPWMTNTLT
jgi:CRISPR-associated protein Cas5/CasD subtype I-E